MHWIGAVFLVVSFAFCVRAFGLVARSREVVAITGGSVSVIRDRSVDDAEKEAALQRDALRLFRLFLVLLFGGAAALLLPLGVIWLADWFGLVSLAEVLEVALSPGFIVAGCLLMLLLVVRAPKRDAGDAYPVAERVLHQLAFHTRLPQLAVADMEDRLWAGKLARLPVERPVFITGLPRAGTTLLLDCCVTLPEFASHIYRDMPFVLTPCLWDRFSARFRKTGGLRERAHGDGMSVGFDSPEAFEEMLWMAFWRRNYRADRIIPWDGEQDPEFRQFFTSHIRKIILLRLGEDPSGPRYISKNNANIARVGVIRQLFPDATLLVPFRPPLQHAASLLRQHLRFGRIHREDRFAGAYMRGIGHFEFGENLRPIDFDGWLGNRSLADAGSLAFWLEYWIAAYRHLLGRVPEQALLFDYQAMCEDPAAGMRRLGSLLELGDGGSLDEVAATIRRPRSHEVDTDELPQGLLREAGELHARLRESARTAGRP